MKRIISDAIWSWKGEGRKTKKTKKSKSSEGLKARSTLRDPEMKKKKEDSTKTRVRKI